MLRVPLVLAFRSYFTISTLYTSIMCIINFMYLVEINTNVLDSDEGMHVLILQ